MSRKSKKKEKRARGFNDQSPQKKKESTVNNDKGAHEKKLRTLRKRDLAPNQTSHPHLGTGDSSSDPKASEHERRWG